MARPSVSSRLQVAQRNKQLVRAISPTVWADRITGRIEDATIRAWAASVILWDLDFGGRLGIDCTPLEVIAEDYPPENTFSEADLVPALKAIGYPNASVRSDRSTYMQAYYDRCRGKGGRPRRSHGYRFVGVRKDGATL